MRSTTSEDDSGTRWSAIQGLSTESEAGVRDIEALVDLLVERGIRAVFVESTVSERNVRALVSRSGGRAGTTW
jgi:manganese/zinc/iron transport system substrate-binding protein